jgi:DinB superfamily/Pentapeptide repeats (8 copies)
MAEQFEFQDLSDSEFWGVDLQRSTFRDVDLSGARISHARLDDVLIDAEIDRLVINGVDVTEFVNERDEWFSLRSQLRPKDPATTRDGWQRYVDAWEQTIARAQALPDAQRHASVDGQWSFVATIRHLVFATDKWFTSPILGGAFHPMGLPNSGSVGFPWPGLDPSADPTFDEAVAVWRGRADQVLAHLGHVGPDAWNAQVEVLENGTTAAHDCVGVVLEEHFHHLRYALRDLAALG